MNKRLTEQEIVDRAARRARRLLVWKIILLIVGTALLLAWVTR
jgi:hypothetical protein